jgi:hypothetical protein
MLAQADMASPFQVACLDGWHQVVSTLLTHGADLNVTCQRCGVPLAAAAEKGHWHTFRILLDHGANVNRRRGWYAHPLVSVIVGQDMQMLDTRIQRGANIGALGGRYGSALMASSSMGMLNLIQSLVACGARVNDENEKGTDSLHVWRKTCSMSRCQCTWRKASKRAKCCEGGQLCRDCPVSTYAGVDVDFFDEHYGNSVQTAASARV